MRLKIVRNASIENVGKSESCMVYQLRIIFKRTRNISSMMMRNSENKRGQRYRMMMINDGKMREEGEERRHTTRKHAAPNRHMQRVHAVHGTTLSAVHARTQQNFYSNQSTNSPHANIQLTEPASQNLNKRWH
eukprot:COSAG05_NODE_679_length_7979_cov_22.454442_5_plen_133_part_00